MNRRSNRGVALVTTLLIVALASVIAVQMVSGQRVGIHRTSNIITAERLWQQLLGVEAWAVGRLIDDQSGPGVDHLADSWNTRLPATRVDDGVVKGQMQDLQGRFNLNSLLLPVDKTVNESAVKVLKKLFTQLSIEQGKINALLDWLDSDSTVRFPGGAEDELYLARDRPYRAANDFMATTAELLLVEGFTVEDVEKLSQLTTILPGPTAINVNTAPLGVLMAAIEGLTEQGARALIMERVDQPFTSLDVFFGHSALSELKPDKQLFSVSSQYFLVTGNVIQDDRNLQLDAILFRNNDKKVRIIQRKRSSL